VNFGRTFAMRYDEPRPGPRHVTVTMFKLTVTKWANLPPSLSDFGPWSQFFPDLDLESGVSSWASGGPQELSAGCAPPKTEVIAPRYSYNAGKTGLDGVATRRAVGEGFL
jgi:hypothetical protein